VLSVAKPKNRSTQPSRSSAILLVLLIIGLSIIAGLFFADYREVRYDWFITVFWLAAATFAGAFGIIYYAQFVLPHHKGENWLEGVAMMLRAATHFEAPAQASLRSVRASKQTAPATDELSPSFGTLGAGMVRSYQVLAVGKGASFARPAGPGFVRLQSGEKPMQLIDLRQHVRSAEATANTRDGIPLETEVSVVFQVKQNERDHEGEHLEYPYDKSAIFWVSQLNSFDSENNIRPWSEQLVPQAVTYMISEIAQFTLDEMWQDPALFNGIQQRVRRQLRSSFDEWGVKINSVKITPQKLPERVAAQRMENWRAPWQSQIAAQAAAGNAEALRRIRLAKARAQVEIIEKIMQSIEEMRASAQQASLPEIVTLRVIDVLEEAATRSTAQAYLPSQVLANLSLTTSRDSGQSEGDNGDG
jgi:hypothetical protein